MGELAADLKELNSKPEAVQDFTPTPMTLSTTIYYTGINPYTGENVYVARDLNERRIQKRYFFWYRKEDAAFIAGRMRGKRANPDSKVPGKTPGLRKGYPKKKPGRDAPRP
jgi:radical SAM superfamily enzyme YgiQ (UPF0313 family)